MPPWKTGAPISVPWFCCLCTFPAHPKIQNMILGMRIYIFWDHKNRHTRNQYQDPYWNRGSWVHGIVGWEHRARRRNVLGSLHNHCLRYCIELSSFHDRNTSIYMRNPLLRLLTRIVLQPCHTLKFSKPQFIYPYRLLASFLYIWQYLCIYILLYGLRLE